ncbi:MAG TPA: cytochrome C, partial [Rhodanobacteraceae bacterium]|nr:cytochrome C [Rhodanobacteraceae bacterium]
MKKMFRVVAVAVLLAGAAIAAEAGSASRKSIQHGEFLVNYGGCNDCHTPGWAMNNGQAPKEALLTGGGMNFQGPWGTTYAPNLRIYMQNISEKQWIHNARTLK